MRERSTSIVVLDAMGVLYEADDDVELLLVPFILEHLGRADHTEIVRYYIEASLGSVTSAEFWSLVGMSGTSDSEYLSRHRLAHGVRELLQQLRAREIRTACLSNDVSEWSLWLRTHFGLDEWIKDWFISGDLKERKPAPGIYRALIERTGANPRDILFFDDREANLDAAAKLGISTVLVAPESRAGSGRHRRIRSLHEAAAVVDQFEQRA